MVCPYSFDAPGGVQNHALQLCAELRRRGHDVSLIAPGTESAVVPEWVCTTGRSVPIPYNGSVARLALWPGSRARLRRWIQEGDFDLVHVHEPNAPSLSMMTLKYAEGAFVATYHSSSERSIMLKLAMPLLEPLLHKVRAGIAVSHEARRWLLSHVAGDQVLIPNGVDTEFYAEAAAALHPSTGPATDPAHSRRIVFLGRFDEPRKGLPLLLKALPTVQQECGDVQLVIMGSGDRQHLESDLERRGLHAEIHQLPSEAEKAALLAGADVYVAPNTGGESFGIVLIEAMSAGAPVVASDIPAFTAVTDGGRAGRLFPNRNADALAKALIEVLTDSDVSDQLREAGTHTCAQYDWRRVTDEIERVYATVLSGQPGVQWTRRSQLRRPRIRMRLPLSLRRGRGRSRNRNQARGDSRG